MSIPHWAPTTPSACTKVLEKSPSASGEIKTSREIMHAGPGSLLFGLVASPHLLSIFDVPSLTLPSSYGVLLASPVVDNLLLLSCKVESKTYCFTALSIFCSR